MKTPIRESCVIPILKSPQNYHAYRINLDSTNRLAIVFDLKIATVPLTYCIEIFDVGGKTPPNRHQSAIELFFVIKGKGIAMCDGKEVVIRSGDTLLVPPTGIHEIRNTEAERLYTLTLMVPNENFAELIRSGVPVALDTGDLAVLQREPHF